MKVTPKVHGELMAARKAKRAGKPAGPEPTLVQLTSGERIEASVVRANGVMTDAGLIPWDQVDGFWAWSSAAGRRLFVPVTREED